MITVSPSLLGCDFLNIESEMSAFRGFNDIWYHLDVMDGHFVPNLTFGHPIIKKIASISEHPLDAHFMVSNPAFYVETLKDVDLHNVTFHLEAMKDKSISIIDEAKNYFPSVGISIKPRTPFSDLSEEILNRIDLLLVMSVEPGFGGQSFIEATYDKLTEISEYRSKHQLNFTVQVDGGVSDKNSKKLIEYGATNLVAGSYIFKAGQSEYKNQIDKMLQ